ncbi:deoxyribonuclease IV [Candidatus Obscuribacterales bacterium]|nr:deoxyribonuclease IV [Candidatus Obscuribacterales bacterium]
MKKSKTLVAANAARPERKIQKEVFAGKSTPRDAAYPLIGAHTNGGITGAVAKALEIGAQSMQIFIGSPQTWKPPHPAPADIKKFREDVARENLGPLFVHGNYLVNLATLSLENLQKSVLNLHTALRLSDAIGAEGLIFHPGSAGSAKRSEAIDRVLAAMTVVLKDYDGQCRLLMEVCAGQGQTIGDDFGELGTIIAELNYDKRIGVAWDTCHLYNAGFDVATEKGLAKTVSEFDKLVGFEWLFAVHANDSKNPLGSRKDRHENIGQGYIGEEGFRRMLHHPELRSLPWMLEVPGFDEKGPDRKNIEILHRLSA